jgi:hypothetical protein
VLVNGSSTSEFNYKKGVRQGDPLSRFIFILSMEAFLSFVGKVVSSDIINGVVIPNGVLVLSHLIFADDVILLGEWSRVNAINFKRLVRCFALVSG